MAQGSSRWSAALRSEVYRELEHPADLLLEIRAQDLPGLLANALIAFYDQSADLAGFEPRRELTLEVHGDQPADALRNLLSEALYHFDTERFVGTEASVTVEGPAPGALAEELGPLRVRAFLRGENADPHRHVLTTEIKAVTYHLLSVEKVVTDGGSAWRATVLFDI